MTTSRLYRLLLKQRSHPCSIRRISLCIVLGSMTLCLVHLWRIRKDQQPCVQTNETRLASPFRHTLAFIRFNSLHPERISVMEKYRPFFAELHYSMPNYTSEISYTADGWQPYKDIYKAVGDTMKLVLEEHPEIKGLLYFHFDVSSSERSLSS